LSNSGYSLFPLLSLIAGIIFVSVLWQDTAPCDHDITIILHMLSVEHCFQLSLITSNSVEVIISAAYFPAVVSLSVMLAYDPLRKIC
jgi:hypothetical protein